MIRFKIDVLKELKNKGFNTSTIRKERFISEACLQQIRHENTASIKTINTICRLLNKQPGQILEYVPDNED